LPDLRGRVPAGKDNMGGSAAGRIGSVVTDSGTIVGTTLGSAGGSSTHIQTTAEMAAHAHGTTEVAHDHAMSPASPGVLGPGAGQGFAAGGSASATLDITPALTGLTVNTAGGSNAMSILDPMLIVNFIIFVGA